MFAHVLYIHIYIYIYIYLFYVFVTFALCIILKLEIVTEPPRPHRRPAGSPEACRKPSGWRLPACLIFSLQLANNININIYIYIFFLFIYLKCLYIYIYTSITTNEKPIYLSIYLYISIYNKTSKYMRYNIQIIRNYYIFLRMCYI